MIKSQRIKIGYSNHTNMKQYKCDSHYCHKCTMRVRIDNNIRTLIETNEGSIDLVKKVSGEKDYYFKNEDGIIIGKIKTNEKY